MWDISLLEVDLLCEACDSYITELKAGDPNEFKAAAISTANRIRGKLIEIADDEVKGASAEKECDING